MKFIQAIWRCFLTILGDIKVYRFPFFMVYDPTTFRVKGIHTRNAMDVLCPGDIVLRRYECYMDGWFIPGKYTHSGIYVGNGKIIHAIAENVCEIDVIDFLRCDGFCILRPNDGAACLEAIERAKSLIGCPYDFYFSDDNESYYCHELTASCYPGKDIRKKASYICGIRVSPRYLANSFIDSNDFSIVLEV